LEKSNQNINHYQIYIKHTINEKKGEGRINTHKNAGSISTTTISGLESMQSGTLAADQI